MTDARNLPVLNIGVIGVGLGQWLTAAAVLIFFGRALEVAAVISFAAHAWQRIKPTGA